MTVKLNLDPMPKAREAAVVRANRLFASLSGSAAHQEAAWRRKREVAQRVLAKGADQATAEFVEEATLRGLGAPAFAEMIAAKPDPAELADARELCRQKLLLAIDACVLPSALEALFNDISKV